MYIIRKLVHITGNLDMISKEILNPMKNLFICGEAFSQKQAWV